MARNKALRDIYFMQAPPTPVDETQRLRSLVALGVLDTMPEDRFDRITRLACRAFAVPIALVSLVDRDRTWLKSQQGLDGSDSSRRTSFCGHAVLHEGPLVIADALLDPRFADNPFVEGTPKIRFYAGHPVHGVDGSRVGTLCLVDRQPRRLSEEDLMLLKDLAGMIDREFSLMARASTDGLTSLTNRHGFTEVAVHVLALCRRMSQPAVAIGIDLDHFKSINDNHGHEAGDGALRVFSKLLFKNFRSSDVVARFGGDEFVILCSGTATGQAALSLERLRAEFDSSTLVQKYPGLSWSAGIAEFDPASDATIEDLLRTADARMYEAKVASIHRRHQVR
jgi:diguanylate cyclase (GGDEF)-like protein